MEIVNYPLLLWPVSHDHVCGHLVGTYHELVSKNVKKIKKALEDLMIKEALDNRALPPAIQDARFKILPVEVRPAYKQKEGVYPAATPVYIPVAAVFGENDYGYFECFLPLLREHFFFYELEQADSLIEHFARDKFQELRPEEIHRYLTPTTPWLENLTVRLPKPVKEKQVNWDLLANSPTLLKVAERYPLSKSLQEKTHLLPEAAWEQGEKVQQVCDKILKEQVNLVLVAEHGVGKSAILLEAIGKIHHLSSQNPEQPPRLFWKTSPHKMVAGARYLGEWQEICENVLQELTESKSVLWLLDFVNLFRVGGEGVEDSLASFMLPYLQSGKIQIVSEVTPREWDAVRTLAPGFTENFQTMVIEEMSENKVWKVMEYFGNHAREKLGIELEKRAVEISYRLLRRFVKYESFPGKAAHFLSKCVNAAYLKKQSRIGERQVFDAFIEQTGLSELFLRDDLLLDSHELAAYFRAKIIGQDEAMAKICSVIKIFKAGLNNPSKPIATMVFAGPTGVGKTAMARALADFFFSKGQKLNPLIRLDMSEFQYPHQVARLIGSGTEPGKLIAQVRERPFSVVLLDEIEKADSSIFDALLTVLDEGILVDRFGRSTDFRNTIIIMTSNLGVGIGKSLGFSGDKLPDFESSIRNFFRPEFYNRLDLLMIFRPLTAEMIAGITRKELSELSQREGLAKRGIRLVFTEALIGLLAGEGFDERYGARPLQRTIEKQVVAPIAQLLIANQELRDCVLTVDYAAGAIQLCQG